MLHHVGHDLLSREQSDTNFLDLQTACNITQSNGFGIITTGCQNQSDHGKDHVASTCDVVDLPLTGWQNRLIPGRVDQGHSIAVEGHDRRLHTQLGLQLTSCRQPFFVCPNGHTGGQAGLKPIGRHAVHALIFRVIVATDRVGKDTFPSSASFLD